MSAPAIRVPTRRAIAGRRRANITLPLLFLLPSFLLYALFALVPIVQTVQISFLKWDGFSTARTFVGAENYQGLASDAVFRSALWHNVTWTVMTICVAVSAALLLSVTLARLRRGRTFFRVAFFLPNVISLSVVAIIWGQLYHPLVGPVNIILKRIGLGHFARLWLGDPATVLPAINVANNWQSYGFYMILLLAGLQGIDTALYDAALVDGAGTWALFQHVTLPGLRNVLNLVVILAFINALKGFTLVWVMTEGGPVHKSDLLATYIFRAAFVGNTLGPAAAASVVLSVIVVVTTVAFNRLREEEIA